MGFLNRWFNREKKPVAGSHTEIAQGIVRRYHRRNAQGELQVGARLYMELQGVMTKAAADEVILAFQGRRSRGDSMAERLLVQNILEALHDHALTYQTSKPIYRPAEPEAKPKRDRTPPSAAKTSAKALKGQPITDADENAVLFDPYLRDEQY